MLTKSVSNEKKERSLRSLLDPTENIDENKSANHSNRTLRPGHVLPFVKYKHQATVKRPIDSLTDLIKGVRAPSFCSLKLVFFFLFGAHCNRLL